MNRKEFGELVNRVAELEQQVAFLMQHLQVDYQPPAPAGPSPAVLDLLRRGRRLDAINQYRGEKGVGLREAKEYIDSLL